MKLHLALALGLSIGTAAMAEPAVNPGTNWWTAFFTALDGVAPDLEHVAKQDPQYLAADEFTRAEVLARIVERLRAEQAVIDVAATEVVMSISARLGDYSVEQGGFPVSIFGQNVRVRPGHRDLFFRNWEDFGIYSATVDEGRALRERIGNTQVRADVTMGGIRKSTTRDHAYDARVLSVAHYAEDGLLLAKLDAPVEQVIAGDEEAAMVDAVRRKLLDLAGIPPLGTGWEEARALLPNAYPIVASDRFAYPDTGITLAFVHEGGHVVNDYPHEADKPFRIFLQQVDGAWRVRPHISVNMNDITNATYAVDTKGTGPGLACYTPEVNDRCGVLEFSPTERGHVLTRAYGVIELERTGTPREVFDAFVADNGAVFEGVSAPLGYDAQALRLGVPPRFPESGGVPAYAAGAGARRDGTPLYDPLGKTGGITAINREIALFVVDGAETRVPLIFVLQ